MCYGILEIAMLCIYASYIGFNESNIFHVKRKSQRTADQKQKHKNNHYVIIPANFDGGT